MGDDVVWNSWEVEGDGRLSTAVQSGREKWPSLGLDANALAAWRLTYSLVVKCQASLAISCRRRGD